MSAETDIFEFIAKSSRPVRLNEIAEATGYTQPAALVFVKRLISQGRIIEGQDYIITGQYRRAYKMYSAVKEQKGVPDALKEQYREFEKGMLQKYTEFSAEVHEEVKEIRQISQKANQVSKKLYADIITLMGIFVSIFSLVIINIQAIQGIIDSKNVWSSLLRMLLINVPLLVTIIVLLISVRLIIINPLLGRKKDKRNKVVTEIECEEDKQDAE